MICILTGTFDTVILIFFYNSTIFINNYWGGKNYEKKMLESLFLLLLPVCS